LYYVGGCLVKRVKPDVALHILRTDPEKAFIFAKNVGEYTGDTASSLTNLLDHLPSLPMECIEFHLYPRPPDFAQWIQDTLGDEYLATQTQKINRSLQGEALRRTIQELIEDRLHELKVIAMTGVSGIGVQYATKLVDAGVDSVEDLAHYESHELSQKMGVSERVAARWIQNAHQILSTL
jgi:hypothetical protein